MTLDVSSILAARIWTANLPAGIKVLIPDGITPIEFPCVLISQTSEIGNTWEGYYTATYVIACIATSDLDCIGIAKSVRDVLDGWGGNGIEDVRHEMTIPTRNDNTNPISFSRTLTLIVTYQELKSS